MSDTPVVTEEQVIRAALMDMACQWAPPPRAYAITAVIPARVAVAKMREAREAETDEP